MYRALYRKWRPVDFDDVWGQDQVTGILKYEVASGKLSHAYLFCGSRGTGKTSSAKILAKAVNCLSPRDGNPCNECAACRSIDAGTATDVIEMDAASNTGVDDVRDIRDEIVFTPAELKYRVYIIDEVHMMTGSAFNALLKTLEEPPAHVIFILATTELHKLPSTIVSRCQRFDFRRISGAVLAKRLLHIASHEGIELTDGGARLLARLAVGGMRDAISLFELCAGMKERIDENLVASVCGAGDREAGYALIEAIAERNYAVVYGTVRDLEMSSRDLAVFWRDLIDCYRDMCVIKTAKNAADYLDLTDAEHERLRALASRFSMEQLLYHSRVLEDALGRMQRTGGSRRATAELALTRLCDPKLSSGEESLLARIAELENSVALLSAGQAPRITAAPQKKAEPASAVQEPPAQTVAEAPAAPAKEQSAEEKPAAYRAFSGWREVTEEIGRQKASMAAPLNGSRAAISPDGHLVVRVGNAFFLTLLNREDALATIRAVATGVSGVAITSVEVQAEGKKQSESILGELERALADTQ